MSGGVTDDPPDVADAAVGDELAGLTGSGESPQIVDGFGVREFNRGATRVDPEDAQGIALAEQSGTGGGGGGVHGNVGRHVATTVW